ncbi:M24 family metallopeptidase [Stratiformator vulcanicus]|uniref:Putative peptidase n=1 Tax=Stratiformator vulcanicus TaxID=2527980 RepID=A0A517R055_9PLAN|nr:M24 family metallopeptidase [Stratiformator vulcanicus]QDT37204.1 putative peptidase [Stratiformator vulcanicus]
MFDLASIQAALQEEQVDGWLLFDFRGSNDLARRVLDFPAEMHASRRWAYWIPAEGAPRKLNHQIESNTLAHLPGDGIRYLTWASFEEGLKSLCSGAANVAMEYSPRNGNPYISQVDAGIVELVRETGAEVVSSGDLIQRFEATLSDQQVESHLEAAHFTNLAFEKAWAQIATAMREGTTLTETGVRDSILQHFESSGLVTDHSPIVAVGPHAGDPHYETGTGTDCEITDGCFVLVDLWGKLDTPDGVYSDLTRVAVVGRDPSQREAEIFQIVADARDAAVRRVRSAFQNGERLEGWQVDRAARDVIEGAGFGEYFIHRTGHSIGRETHGNGTHMDDLETHDTRRVLPRTLFSIEPGIYLDDFGVRSEINVLIDGDGAVRITGGGTQAVIEQIRA